MMSDRKSRIASYNALIREYIRQEYIRRVSSTTNRVLKWKIERQQEQEDIARRKRNGERIFPTVGGSVLTEHSQLASKISVRFLIYRDRTIFDDVIIKRYRVYRDTRKKRFVNYNPADKNYPFEWASERAVYLCKRGLDAYIVSAYIATISKSTVYRRHAMKVFEHFRLYYAEFKQLILIRLRKPRRQFLDYKWSEKLMQLVIERQKADHAMSWLSTLGGAFSALGEEFEHCAKMAGKISVKQFELAMRLDNPLLVARCRLYAALSLIQRGRFATPKHMIRQIYELAVREKDVRLQNMCHGVWAKWRYSYKQHRQQKRSLLLETLHISS